MDSAAVLLLCFTELLAQWLARHRGPTGVCARFVSAVAAEIMAGSGVDMEQPTNTDPWDELYQVTRVLR